MIDSQIYDMTKRSWRAIPIIFGGAKTHVYFKVQVPNAKFEWSRWLPGDFQ